MKSRILRKFSNLGSIRLGKEPSDLVGTWTNIGFSYDGMKKLAKNMEEVNAYLDQPL